VKLDILRALNAEKRARRAAILVTELASGHQRLVREVELAGEAAGADPLAGFLAEAMRAGKSGTITTEQGAAYFLTVTVPPVKIVVSGAVHISQALAPMAKLAGFDVTIVDPRTAFATPDRFPEIALIADWPGEALPRIGGLDRYSAVVALTHDPKIDDPMLEAALRSDSFYVGALGSRKTHARRVERLAAAGFGAADIARIKAPVGLNIGAVSPAEIAVAILGEIIAALRAERVAAKARAAMAAA
jgi:xanthine dehydrogenase accessory factor